MPSTRLTLVPALRLAAAALLVLGGCATLTVVPAERLAEQQLTPGAEPVAHIYAANWGLYLFKYLPLITGSLARPGAVQWPSLFSDEVQIDRLVGEQAARWETYSPTCGLATDPTGSAGR